jgi:hypothetical protein
MAANTLVWRHKWVLNNPPPAVIALASYSAALVAGDGTAVNMDRDPKTYDASLLRGDAIVLAAQRVLPPQQPFDPFPTESPTFRVNCSKYRGKKTSVYKMY